MGADEEQSFRWVAVEGSIAIASIVSARGAVGYRRRGGPDVPSRDVPTHRDDRFPAVVFCAAVFGMEADHCECT